MAFTKNELLDYAADVADALNATNSNKQGLGFMFGLAAPLLNLFQLYQANQRNKPKMAPNMAPSLDYDLDYRPQLPKMRPY